MWVLVVLLLVNRSPYSHVTILVTYVGVFVPFVGLFVRFVGIFVPFVGLSRVTFLIFYSLSYRRYHINPDIV